MQRDLRPRHTPLLLASFLALQGCDAPPGMDMDAGLDASTTETGVVNSQTQLARAILFSHRSLSAIDRRSLCQGSCPQITDNNVRYACLQQCIAITDPDMRYLCQGACPQIADTNLRNFCYGRSSGSNQCDQLPMLQDRALCNGPDAMEAGVTPGCELLIDIPTRAFCQGNCPAIY